MDTSSRILSCFVAVVAILLASCASEPKWKIGPDGKPINPYPVGSYKHFTAEPSYPKTYKTWRHVHQLPEADSSECHIKIDLKKQRGFLMYDETVLLDYPICSGTKDRPTPVGEFVILEKKPEKRSNLYGKIYDAEDNIVVRDADFLKDEIPEGGRFEGAPMNYWMRLTNDGVGHHIGPVRRRPSSHGCVRGPSKVIPIIFKKVNLGTKVVIK